MQPKITYVSHACIVIENEDTKLVCDPWILNEPVFNFTTWKFPSSNLSVEEVTVGATHLYISHAHEDHFHIPSIDKISRDIQVILPEYTWHPGLRAQTIERTLREMGFYKITKFKPWEKSTLGTNFHVTFVPAAESKPQDWENSGLVIEVDNTKILNLNDNPTDEPQLKDINLKFGDFDIIFVQYAGVSCFPGRFKMTLEEMREEVRKKRISFSEQEKVLKYLKTKNLIPFAGDFCWLDDELFHCNWACRSTPKVFEEWLNNNVSTHKPNLILMYPSDEWTPSHGLIKKHKEIEWENYLEEIEIIKNKFQYKIDSINKWLCASSFQNLKERTKNYMNNMEKWANHKEIDFSSSIRFLIEGKEKSFSFVINAKPDTGFQVSWDENFITDQTCYVSDYTWASILEAKLVFNSLPWSGVIEQHVPFRMDMGKLWWWLEFYADLNNRNPQILLEKIQFPHIKETVRPNLGVFNVTTN